MQIKTIYDDIFIEGTYVCYFVLVETWQCFIENPQIWLVLPLFLFADRKQSCSRSSLSGSLSSFLVKSR